MLLASGINFSHSYLFSSYWLSLYNFFLTSIVSCHLNQVAPSIHYAFFCKLFLTPQFVEFFHQLLLLITHPLPYFHQYSHLCLPQLFPLSITKASAFFLPILSSTLSDYKSLLIDRVLTKFDTSSVWLLSTSSFSTFSPVSFNCL